MAGCACHTYLWDAQKQAFNNMEKTCGIIWWVYWRHDRVVVPKRWLKPAMEYNCDRCHCEEDSSNPNVRAVLPFLVAAPDPQSAIAIASRHWGRGLNDRHSRKRFEIISRRKKQ